MHFSIQIQRLPHRHSQNKKKINKHLSTLFIQYHILAIYPRRFIFNTTTYLTKNRYKSKIPLINVIF